MPPARSGCTPLSRVTSMVARGNPASLCREPVRHPIALRHRHHARLLARRLLRPAVSTVKNLHYPLRVRDRGVFEGALTGLRKLSPIGRSLGGCHVSEDRLPAHARHYTSTRSPPVPDDGNPERCDQRDQSKNHHGYHLTYSAAPIHWVASSSFRCPPVTTPRLRDARVNIPQDTSGNTPTVRLTG